MKWLADLFKADPVYAERLKEAASGGNSIAKIMVELAEKGEKEAPPPPPEPEQMCNRCYSYGHPQWACPLGD